MDIERRIHNVSPIEVRKADQSSASTLRGYAAVFNTLSQPLCGFREQIAPGAFDGVLNGDVRALFNHDPNHVLGRTLSKTLRLNVDKVGLFYEVDLPDTQAARDLTTCIDRGDVSQSSFAFRVAPNGDTWDENEDGIIIRTITKFAILYDVSPVTYPAYLDATVDVRSFDAFRASKIAADQTVRSKRQAESRTRQLILNR